MQVKGNNEMNYKMSIAYDGTRYKGWQKQGDTDNTIQQKIEAVLSRLAGVPVDVHGAGRTDAGVHAKGQVAQFRLDDDIAPEKIRSYLNEYLPDDIGIIDVTEASPRFHSRYNASEKTYTYRIATDMSKHVFDRKYVMRHEEPLDTASMEKAASYFVGKHDFKSFCGNPHFKKSTIREIYSIDIIKSKDEIHIIYKGEGFLQYMVRILTGTLIEVGEGKRDADSMPDILKALDRKKAGAAAPACGLTLTEVKYN